MSPIGHDPLAVRLLLGVYERSNRRDLRAVSLGTQDRAGRLTAEVIVPLLEPSWNDDR